mgnify:CR=1 FL=1
MGNEWEDRLDNAVLLPDRCTEHPSGKFKTPKDKPLDGKSAFSASSPLPDDDDDLPWVNH